MTNLPNNADATRLEVYELADAVLSGTITAEQTQRLNALVCNDPEARRHYVRFMHHTATLRDWAAENEERARANDECGMMNDELPSEAGIVIDLPAAPIHHSSFIIHHSSFLPSFVGEVLFSYLTAAMILGVGMLVAWAWKLPDRTEIAHQWPLPVTQRDPNVGRSTVFVGRITGMVDCQWVQSPESGVQSPALDPRLSTLVSLGDKFALTSGLMEITYNSGARVILQGPVTYEVESRTGGFLSIGKLTARLEKRSEIRDQRSEIRNQKSPDLWPLTPDLFAIRTPTATVTDLGTEFGVEVSERGDTTSHVFRGSVRVQLAADTTQEGGAVVLHKNESVRTQTSEDAGSPSLTLRRVSADRTAFVRVDELPKLAAEQRLKPFRRWQAYSQQLRRDPSLLAYYDFQQREGEPSLLPNVAQNGNGLYDGVVENVTWSTGRMTGKHALAFNGPADCVRINLPKQVDDLTLAAWVYVQSLDNTYNSLLMSEGATRLGGIGLDIRFDGRMSFDIARVTEGVLPSYPISKPGFSNWRFYRWTHVAVVYDHTADSVKFYADGELIDTLTIQPHVPICIGAARIGHWNPGSYRGPGLVRNFHGRMDELVVFGRPLASDEIQRMFEAGKPAVAGNTAGQSSVLNPD